MKKNLINYPSNPFHLVDISPWPILKCISILTKALGIVNWLTKGEIYITEYKIKLTSFILIFILWLRDVIREGKAGSHTRPVKKGLNLGFIIFLISEILLFFSLFWALFHSNLNPSVELVYWPPLGVNAVDYLTLPLLNSILLLAGGFICTWAHHSFLIGNKTATILGMIGGIILTAIFIYIQYIEYSFSEFTISDSVYGSTFYSLTGTHFLHVFIALVMLLVVTFRISSDQLTSEHALGLDLSLIYYHLVDIVWLFLYIVLYYWAS